jgi:hypothetical protein
VPEEWSATEVRRNRAVDITAEGRVDREVRRNIVNHVEEPVCGHHLNSAPSP